MNIDSVIIKANQHMNPPIILSNTNRPKPPYPYIGYTVINGYSKGLGRHVVESGVDGDNIKQTATDQSTFTISFTAYSEDDSEALDVALTLRDYFDFIGYDDLKEIDTVVVSIEAFGNRDTLIVDDYEHRVGFDVLFRQSRKIDRTVATIESYEIREE